MNPMSCVYCLRAKTAEYAVYSLECVGCDIRMLAAAKAEKREQELDKVERQFGRDFRLEVSRCVDLEIARVIDLRRGQGVKACTPRTSTSKPC